MTWADHDAARGWDALRAAVARPRSAAAPQPAGVPCLAAPERGRPSAGRSPAAAYDDSDQAASSEETEAERSRLIALVELARGGDAEAFGLLYDHYQGSVYRFLFYRTRSTHAWPRTSPPRPSSARCGA